MPARQWFRLHCVGCAHALLVPQDVAVRVADGGSFVMCNPCADKYEGETGHEAQQRFGSPPQTAA